MAWTATDFAGRGCGRRYEKETITGEEFMRILTAVPQLPTGAMEQ